MFRFVAAADAFSALRLAFQGQGMESTQATPEVRMRSFDMVPFCSLPVLRREVGDAHVAQRTLEAGLTSGQFPSKSNWCWQRSLKKAEGAFRMPGFQVVSL